MQNRFRDPKPPSTRILAQVAVLLVLMLGPAILNVTGLYVDITLAGLSVTAIVYILAYARIDRVQRATFNRFALWVFGFGFLLHLAYELLHSVLFTHFMMPGYTYPELMVMLLIAAYCDGLLSLLLLMAITLLYPKHWHWGEKMDVKRSLIVLFVATLVQTTIEVAALQMGDWAYTEAMPMIPVLNVGLTPVIQLPLLILPTFWMAGKFIDSCSNVDESRNVTTSQMAGDG